MAVALAGCGGGGAVDTPAGASCTIVDTDFDIDDMMAIPLVIGNRYVAAMITSEGSARADKGASALAVLTATEGQRSIPVIVGGATDLPDSALVSGWGAFLLQYRALMNRLNGFLSTDPPPVPPADQDYPAQVAQAVAACGQVDVLVIGTFTSFVNYSPLIRSRINRVVIMGKPLEGDSTQKPGNVSFNCEYDMPACRKAFFEQLPGLDHAYVDVPRSTIRVDASTCDSVPNHPTCTGTVYGPDLEMVSGLIPRGLPGTLKQVLMHDTLSWALDDWPNSTYGGKSLLWDQSAALFLVHPELFTKLGGPIGHYETTLTPDAFRRKWTEATNMAVDGGP